MAKNDEEAGLVSRKPDQRFQRFHHRDILRRPYSGRRDTRFLNSKDGRPTELVVQSSEELLNPFPVTTETRNYGFYEPVPYKDRQYPYDARNRHENLNPPYKGAVNQPLIGQIK
ncbi:MAG: hypothetical protein LQ339_002729 [Xanthoria mediterranea]|nr:MAG: hypothetical protein LQ339_002729 [Xanthoria mediterranea]